MHQNKKKEKEKCNCS